VVAPGHVDGLVPAVSGYLNLEQGQVGAFKSTAAGSRRIRRPCDACRYRAHRVVESLPRRPRGLARSHQQNASGHARGGLCARRAGGDPGPDSRTADRDLGGAR